MDLSDDGRRLVTLPLLGSSARVWDARTGRLISELAEDGAAMSVAISNDGRRVITTSSKRVVHAWDAESGRPVGSLPHHAGWLSPGAAFSPDDSQVALTSVNGVVPLWNMRSDTPGLRLRPRALFSPEVVGVAFSPDGRLVAVADRSAAAVPRVFDATTGDVVAELRGHRDEARSVAFSPDGRWLVTASVDGTAIVWEAQTGELITQLWGNLAGVVDASFSPDGERILTAGRDGTARIYRCEGCGSLEDLLAAVPNHVSRGRRLTSAEQRAYVP
jgi:WD40 repeat protein